MPRSSPSTVTDLLARATRVVEGVVLVDPWVASPGESFEDDRLDLLVQLDPTRDVVRLRVLGLDAQAVAGRFGRGDRVRAVVRCELPDEDVLLVESAEPA